MTGPREEDVERRTRETLGAAAAASWAIVREVLDRAPEGAGPGWRPPRPATHAHDWRPAPRTAPTGTAVEAGWLVAVPPPASSPVRTRAPGGRLAGMRVAVKDVIDVAGLPTRNGTPGATWRDPTSSAAVWQALADEGAACVGKAATHELAWGVTTDSVPHPTDPSRMPGGSSAGSAACVAAGVADAALGTDTGGSIRIPAALCGVVGLRPTVGGVPGIGVSPLAPTQDVAGPLAHDVSTCAAVAEVLLGRPLGSDDEPRRVGVPSKVGALDGATAHGWAATLQDLRQAGVEVVTVDAAAVLRLASAVSLLTMLWESAHAFAPVADRDPAGLGAEARASVRVGLGFRDDEVATIDVARRTLRTATAALFDDHGLESVLTPTTACVAPPRGADIVELDGRTVPTAAALTRFVAWASAAGLPALSVPAASAGPLPVGVQVLGVPDDETTCFTVAHLLERGARARGALRPLL